MFVTPSQRRGFLFFLLLFAVYLVVQIYLSSFSDDLNQINIINNHYEKQLVEKKNKKKEIISYVKDPNLWSKDYWINLGFSKKQTNTILTYKSKIGGFKNKKQLYSCYVINQSRKNKLDSIVDFPKSIILNKNLIDVFLLKKSIKPCYNLTEYFDTIYFEKKNGEYFYYLIYKQLNLKLYDSSKFKSRNAPNIINKNKDELKIIFKKYDLLKKKSKININKADTLEWTKLKGIGIKTANQILAFRKKLGGFSNINQLKEVYLISDSLYSTMENQLFNDNKVLKFNINKVRVDSLKRHPYINWNLANAIVNFRIQHGQYESIDKIKEIHLVNEEIYLKIAPYLKI